MDVCAKQLCSDDFDVENENWTENGDTPKTQIYFFLRRIWQTQTQKVHRIWAHTSTKLSQLSRILLPLLPHTKHHQQQRRKSSSLSLSHNPIVTFSSFCHFFSVFNGCPHQNSALNNRGPVQVSIFLIFWDVKKIPNRKSLFSSSFGVLFFFVKFDSSFTLQTLFCENIVFHKAFFFSLSLSFCVLVKVKLRLRESFNDADWFFVLC